MALPLKVVLTRTHVAVGEQRREGDIRSVNFFMVIQPDLILLLANCDRFSIEGAIDFETSLINDSHLSLFTLNPQLVPVFL